MLVLSRKTGERILIPELGIEISVLNLGSQRVQIGIQAPKEIQITRPEAGRRTGRRSATGRTIAADRQRDSTDRAVQPELSGKYVVPV